MNANEYQRLTSRTECIQENSLQRMRSYGPVSEPCENMTAHLRPIRANHAAIGLGGEAGEILSLIQKWIYYGKPFPLEELTQKFKDELGDVLWYVALMCNALGLHLQDVMEANIRKLRVRYPDKYSDVQAAEESRDRQKEAETMTHVEQDGHGFGHRDLGGEG